MDAEAGLTRPSSKDVHLVTSKMNKRLFYSKDLIYLLKGPCIFQNRVFMSGPFDPAVIIFLGGQGQASTCCCYSQLNNCEVRTAILF